MNINIKSVIFDMDGVLVDACEWHRLAFNEALKQVCQYEISLEEHYKEYNGLPTKVKLNKLAEKNIITIDMFKKIEDIKQQKTIEQIEKNAMVRQEKIDLMNFLKSKKLLIACYTNSIRKTAELMLSKTGVLGHLDLLVTNQDVNSPKPNPEGYNKVLKFFNSKPEESIIIEDSPNGIQAALATGCKVIKVKNQEEVNIDLFKDIIL